MMSRAVVLCTLVACESSPSKSPPQPVPSAPPGDAAAGRGGAGDAAPADATERKLFITGAGRCGECHEKMFDEWERSGHAQAASSTLYQAARADAKDATCDRCHAPLSLEAPRDLVASEGVTCDVCHTLRDPAPAAAGGTFRLAIDDMIKYGPRCDLDDHYFHRMGCSPEHRDAAICGSCHWWEPRGLPVLTEFADWRAGPQAAEGIACQDCHMPKGRAALATGSPVRAGVPHHGLLGLADDLRRRALGLVVTARPDGDALAVEVTVRNNNAGHAVPAGLPERRVVVRARLIDGKGAEIAAESQALGRTLVDAAGAEAPFWHATRVASDTRIAAGSSRSVTFALPAARDGAIEIDVVYRGLPDAIAARLGVTEIEEHPMARATLKLTGARLPRTITVAPPAPGRAVKRGKKTGTP
jgi:hypothetical protein